MAAARCAVRSGTDSLLARTACIIVRQDPQMLRLSQACVQSGDFRWEPLGLYRPCSGCSGHVVIALWWHACILCVCVCVCVYMRHARHGYACVICALRAAESGVRISGFASHVRRDARKKPLGRGGARLDHIDGPARAVFRVTYCTAWPLATIQIWR